MAGDPEGAPPSTPGPVELISAASGIGIRAEVCVREGEQPAGPESLLITLATRGTTRADAADRLQQALAETDVLLRASSTSKAWLKALCSRPEISAGAVSLGLLEDLAAAGVKLVDRRPDAALLVAAIQAYRAEEELERARFIAEARRGRPRVGPSSGREVELRHAGQRYRFQVRRLGLEEYRISAGAGAAAEVRLERLGPFELQLTWQGRRHRVLCTAEGLRQLVQVDDVAHLVLRDPGGFVVSPMPAVVAAIQVERGQRVAAGDPLARIESMKVEVQITAPFAGVVREVLAPVNGQVDAGAPLVKLEPLNAAEPELRDAPASFSLGAAGGSVPDDTYRAAVARLRLLLLGFDVTPAEARQLAAALRELAEKAGRDDQAVLQAEDQALGAFADVQSLFNRARAPDGRPPLEELWRYLHEPERQGAGLSPGFVAMLRRALSRYGVSMDAAGGELELALLRIQKAHDRVEEQLGAIVAILDRRLRGAGEGASREVLDRLVELGQERFPALADLAREVRYREFDQPALDRLRNEAYAQVDRDLAALATNSGEERESVVDRLRSSAPRRWRPTAFPARRWSTSCGASATDCWRPPRRPPRRAGPRAPSRAWRRTRRRTAR